MVTSTMDPMGNGSVSMVKGREAEMSLAGFLAEITPDDKVLLPTKLQVEHVEPANMKVYPTKQNKTMGIATGISTALLSRGLLAGTRELLCPLSGR